MTKYKSFPLFVRNEQLHDLNFIQESLFSDAKAYVKTSSKTFDYKQDSILINVFNHICFHSTADDNCLATIQCI